jgi:hypothetical protein
MKFPEKKTSYGPDLTDPGLHSAGPAQSDFAARGRRA